MVWTIGRFTLDRHTRELREDGDLVAIEGRVFDFLVAIINHRDRVVDKDELIQTVWSGRIVSDTAISSCVKSARSALGDDGKQQRIIKTIHGKGFRFIADVSDDNAPAPTPDHAPERDTTDHLNNLPAERLALFGRNADIVEICQALSDNRLVSLLGIGGTGKTRLAIACGRQLLPSFADGVWFVDLVPVNEPTGIDLAIAEAIGVTLTSPDPRRELAKRINGRQLLLILDNCEHISDLVMDTIDHLLEQTSGPVLLATSREPLDLADEHRINVEPLRVDRSAEPPTNNRQSGAEEGMNNHSPAAQLFCTRAARHGIVIAPENLESVRIICQHLDGLPLAIELAAAQLRQLQLDELSARLDRRFDLLAGRQRPGSERQASLLNVLADTWEMLDESEKEMLSQLAVFPGTFTVTDIEELVGDQQNLIVPRLFGRLVDRSLVRREGVQWRLLETVRLFAQRQMAADEHQHFMDMHAQWCLNRVGNSVQEACYSRTQANWCTNHYTDLRVARDYFYRSGRYDDAARILMAQSYSLHRDDGTRAATALREFDVYRKHLTDRALIVRLHFAGVLSGMAARLPGQLALHARAGLDAARECNEATLHAIALVLASWSTVFQDIDQALEQVRFAANLAQDAGDDQTRDFADSYQACHLGLKREYDEAANLARAVLDRSAKRWDTVDYPLHAACDLLSSISLIDDPKFAYEIATTKGDNQSAFTMWASKLLIANCAASVGHLRESAAICTDVHNKLKRSGVSGLPDLLIPASYMAYQLGETERAKAWLRTVKEAGQPTQSFQMTITYRRLREAIGLSQENPLDNQSLETVGVQALDWMNSIAKLSDTAADSTTAPR